MSKTTYPWYNVVAFALITSCALGGVAVVCISGYDLSQTFKETKLEERIKGDIRLIEKTDCGGCYEYGKSTYCIGQKSNKRCKNGGESDAATGPLDSEAVKTYKIILILSFIAAMILGLTQFVSSSMVICMCNTGSVRNKVKVWVVVSMFVFLFGILCFFLPLTYDVGKGKAFNLHDLPSYLEGKFLELINVRNAERWEQNLYFYVFGCNQMLLMVSVLMLMALLPCGTQPYDSVY